MITKKDVRLFILKLRCMQYSKLGGYYLARSVDATIQRNFGYGEQYQRLAEKYYRKLGETVDRITEVAH